MVGCGALGLVHVVGGGAGNLHVGHDAVGIPHVVHAGLGGVHALLLLAAEVRGFVLGGSLGLGEELIHGGHVRGVEGPLGGGGGATGGAGGGGGAGRAAGSHGADVASLGGHANLRGGSHHGGPGVGRREASSQDDVTKDGAAHRECSP